jgi:hypothetical protein
MSTGGRPIRNSTLPHYYWARQGAFNNKQSVLHIFLLQVARWIEHLSYLSNTLQGIAHSIQKCPTSVSCKFCARRTSKRSEQGCLAGLQFLQSAYCSSGSHIPEIPPRTEQETKRYT